MHQVDPNTLSITHICDYDEVVTGGEDGQIWVATFASRSAAEGFIFYMRKIGYPVQGQRAGDERG